MAFVNGIVAGVESTRLNANSAIADRRSHSALSGRWWHQQDIDGFFKNVYHHYDAKGLMNIVAKGVLDHLRVVFVVFIILLMTVVIDYNQLNNVRTRTRAHPSLHRPHTACSPCTRSRCRISAVDLRAPKGLHGKTGFLSADPPISLRSTSRTSAPGTTTRNLRWPTATATFRSILAG